MNVVIQWLDRGIAESFTELDGSAIRAVSVNAREIWPGLRRHTPESLPGRRVFRKAADASESWTAFGTGETPAP
jgi:hypothetical protein